MIAKKEVVMGYFFANKEGPEQDTMHGMCKQKRYDHFSETLGVISLKIEVRRAQQELSLSRNHE